MNFIVNDTFQFRGVVFRAGTVISASDTEVQAEIEKGKHPKAKRNPWLSGLLNHCTPADDATAAFISKATGQDVKAAAKNEDAAAKNEDEMAVIIREFDEMGAAYDRRWSLPKMKNELMKAKRHRGV